NEDLGRLIIKEYPTRSCSVNMIRNHIEKLKLRGFIPSMIVIDYADIMKSSKSYDSIRHELMLVYEELRQLSQDFNLPIWTASQSNRAGSGADVVGLENMSEAYGKAMVADCVITLARKPEEKASGLARLFVAKNRAGRDGLIFPIRIDTSMSHFIELSEDEAQELAPKQKLKQAWNDFKREKRDMLQ
ncbi:MAG: DnaB-like helicase C-terminal domain-containing protein, partial [Verrucomicrobiota bacterium]|nr:DnaB-like helicase C-terminal domain-containing protein [Verrucomicrobiota bacterium]